MNKQRYDMDEAWVQRYREGNLSEEERAWLQAHPFEAEALEGLAETPQWPQDVSELQQKLRERTAKRTARERNLWGVYSRYAAALALLVMAGWFTYRFAMEEDTPMSPVSVARQEEPAAAERVQPAPTAPEKITSEGVTPMMSGPRIAQAQRTIAPVPVPEKTTAPVPSAVSSPGLEEHMALSDEEESREQRTQETDYSMSAPALSQGISSFRAKSRTATPQEQFGHHVTGSVFSADDRVPLPGVNVIVKGTVVGTVTDMDGYFSVPVSDSSETTLVFSSVGYISEEVAADRQDSLAVALEPDVQSLSEVVEAGYAREDDALSQAAYPLPSRKAFRKYLKDQLRYPEAARQHGIEGTVRVRFTVKADGRLTNFQIQKSLGYGCDEEAIRLIREGPGWQPALRNGQAQAQDMSVKVRFTL